jgi:predicted nucleic acid-binding protein
MIGDMLDTNVIIKYLAGDELAKQLIDNVTTISVSVIVVGELHYGAQKSSRTESNLALFESFLSNFDIIPVDKHIAVAYGKIKEQLRDAGINIPENDIWIAATAKSRQSRLLSFDIHFRSIKGLDVVP